MAKTKRPRGPRRHASGGSDRKAPSNARPSSGEQRDAKSSEPLVRAPSQSTRGQNIALTATPPQVVSIFSEAESGRTRRLIDLKKSARVLDTRLGAVIAARVQTLTGRPIVFHPPPGFESDAEAQRCAANTTRAWNAVPHSFALIGHLHHGAIEHIAGAELEWIVDPLTRWTIAVPRFAHAGFIHANRFAWNEQIEPCVMPGDDYGSFPGIRIADHPARFIVHAPIAGMADYPWRRGAARDRLIPSLTKRNIGVKGWTQVLERWGQPQVVAYEDDESKGDAIIESLRKLGLDWRAMFPSTAKVTPIDVAVDNELHAKFIDHVNLDHAIRILGQNLTTEVKDGSFAAAAAHNRVRYDILAADAAELAETLWRDWVLPFVQFNFPSAPPPYPEFVLMPRRELTAQDFTSGLYSADEVRLSQGHDVEPDGRGRRYAVASAAAPKTSGAGETAGDPAKPSDTGEPGPSKPEGGDERPAQTASADPGDAAEAVTDDGVETAAGDTVEKLADAALNGAQMAALETIVTKVEDGLRAPETAVELITAEFATITKTKAEAIVKTIAPRAPAAAGPPPTPVAVPVDDEDA